MEKNDQLIKKNSGNTSSEKNKSDYSDFLGKALKGVMKTTYGNLFVINYLENNLEFIPKLPEYICDLKIDEIERSGINFLKKITLHSDKKIVDTARNLMFQFYKNLPTDERVKYTMNFDVHVLGADNRKVLINCKISPIQFTDCGSIWRAVSNLSLSLSKSSGNIHISSKDSELVWSYDLEQEVWKKVPKKILSPKEVDIFRFYLQGLTIPEISEKIFLSIDTVKWHRRKLFEKLKVRNINEALAYVMTHNLI